MAEISLIDIACEVFEKESQKEMHVNEIGEIAYRFYPARFANPEDAAKKISSSLASNVKSKSAKFKKALNRKKRPRRGVYVVKQKRAPIKKSIDLVQHKQEVGTQNTGRAGEYAVISELIFLGHNATILPVDNGIDVVSSKNDKFFHIQVKTRIPDPPDSSNISFSIKRFAYENNRKSNDYYVFVIRKPVKNKWTCDYIVLHALQLDSVYQKCINKPNLNVKFEFTNHGVHLDGQNVTAALNDFTKIT